MSKKLPLGPFEPMPEPPPNEIHIKLLPGAGAQVASPKGMQPITLAALFTQLAGGAITAAQQQQSMIVGADGRHADKTSSKEPDAPTDA